MDVKLPQQAFIVTFEFNGHHRWATCPICGAYGPRKEQTLEHLNTNHSYPGQTYILVEAKQPENILNTFWIAVAQFQAVSTVAQDKAVLQDIKKAQGMPLEVIQRIEQGIQAQEADLEKARSRLPWQGPSRVLQHGRKAQRRFVPKKRVVLPKKVARVLKEAPKKKKAPKPRKAKK